MTTHQQKKLEVESLKEFRDRFDLPLSDEQVEHLEFYKPPDTSPEMKYLRARRDSLGGYLPRRRVKSSRTLQVPALESFANFALQAAGKEMSTTTAVVRMIGGLLKDKTLGGRIVPIVADEARTFGMASLFRQIGIYSPLGQMYEPEDLGSMLYYREAKSGQILEEGISEAAAISSWTAAATAYSAHDFPMLPFYIYYSMFGFQRVGDLIWAAADQRARGFLLGATSGRTTLGGEGLQHQDGSSHIQFATVPNCRAYDPAFAYEVAAIIERGMREMLEEQMDRFYYLTVMNANYPHPSMPGGSEVREGIIKGIYRLPGQEETRAQLFGSGAIMTEVLAARDLLQSDWGITVGVWSVTSYVELHRDGIECERWARQHPLSRPQRPFVSQVLAAAPGPIVATSDYLRAVPELIRAFILQRYVTLGTDGFGRSDKRAELRAFFEVDATAIVIATLKALADELAIEQSQVAEAIRKYGKYTDTAPSWSC
jgi:pyruvate dehydrogenase E1 component